MPDFQDYMDWWGDDGMYVHGLNPWDADGGKQWLLDNNCPDLDSYICDMTLVNQWQEYCGIDQSAGSAPANLVVDRDGMIRWYKRGSLTYTPATKDACEKLLRELLGVTE